MSDIEIPSGYGWVAMIEQMAEFHQCQFCVAQLNTTKADLEKGLVEIETNQIIRKYPSEEIYHSLKRELKKRYNQVKSEIEDIRNSLREIGNHNKWFEWIDSFGVFVRNQRDITDSLKKQLLKKVIDYITVDYDNKEKVHRLNVRFKIPVFHMANDLRTHVSSADQNSPVENYSTVTDLARFLGWSTSHPRIRAMW